MRSDIKAGRAYVELLLKDSQFNKKLRAAGKSLKQFGSDMQAMGRTLAFASAAILVPMGLASNTFADFDDRMREVKAVTQATTAEFERMTAQAKMLGATTSYTAIEVAALKAELGRAGFNPTEVDEMTGAVLDLARATRTDATLASGIMAASIRQFALAAGDATRVADALTAAANKSFNTVETLGEALSYAGPVANDFNMSIEETLAILGGLGNVGIQGSNAGTALRRLLTITGAEAEKLKKIFGVQFVDMAGNARPLVDVLSEVNDATKGLGTAARSAKFNEAFGLLGITGASAISKNAVSVKELYEAIQKAGGVAHATAKEMDSGLGGALRIMWSAVEGLQIAIGEALAPALIKAANGVEWLATKAIAFVEANKGMVTAVLVGAAGLGAIGASLLAVAGVITGAMFTFGAIGTVISGVVSVIGAIVAPILALAPALAIAAAGFAPFVLWPARIALAFKGMTAIVKTQARNVASSVVAIGRQLSGIAGTIFTAVAVTARRIPGEVMGTLQRVLGTAIGFVGRMVPYLTDYVAAIAIAIGSWLPIFFATTQRTIMQTVRLIALNVATSPLVQSLAGVASKARVAFITLSQSAGRAVAAMGGNVGRIVGGAIRGILSIAPRMAGVFGLVGNAAVRSTLLIASRFAGLPGLILGLFIQFAPQIAKALSEVPAAFDDIGNEVKRVFSVLGAVAGETWTGLVNAFKKGDLEAAAKVAFAGLNLAWLEATDGLRETWSALRYFFETKTNEISFAVLKVFDEMAARLRKSWLELRDFALDTFDLLVNYLAKIGMSDSVQRELDNILHEKISEREKARRNDTAAIDKELADKLQAIKDAEEEAKNKADNSLLERLEKRKQELEAARKALAALVADTGGADTPAADPDKKEEDERRRRANIRATLPGIGLASRETFSTFSAAGLIAGAGGGGEKTQKQILQELRDMRRHQREWQRRMLAAKQGWATP